MVALAAAGFPVLSSPGVSAWGFTNTSHVQVGLAHLGCKVGRCELFQCSYSELSNQTSPGRGSREMPSRGKVPLWVLVIMV